MVVMYEHKDIEERWRARDGVYRTSEVTDGVLQKSDFQNIATKTGFGVLGSVIPTPRSSRGGITTAKQIFTKARRGIIQNVSPSTANKLVAATAIDQLPGEALRNVGNVVTRVRSSLNIPRRISYLQTKIRQLQKRINSLRR